MARRRRFNRSRRVARRRRPCDVIPLSLCAQLLPVPQPGPDQSYTCDNPLKHEIVLLDGAALDTILRSVDPGDYLSGGQGLTRGLSFLGAEFWMCLSFTDQVASFM